MKKQYVITEAYKDNYKVIQYVDGVYDGGKIVAYYELDGYISALENMGYEKAYDVDEAEKEMLEAKEKYELALHCYEHAKNHALIKEK